MPYLRETMIAGNVIELREYYTARYGQKGYKRERHKNETPLAAQIVNHRNSERKLRGLLEENFAPEDHLVTLTYKQGSRVDEETALADVRKMLRLLKKGYKAEGRNLKYIYVVEQLTRSVHIHMILPRIKADLIRKSWKEATERAASAHFEPLWEGDFATKLASYLLKEYDPRREGDKPYRKPTGVKFHTSRNLVKPEIIKEVMKRTKIPKQPYIKKGYILLPDSYFEGVDAFTGYEYRTYTLLRS